MIIAPLRPYRPPDYGYTLEHQGVDWLAPIGTPVYAAHSGTARVGQHPDYGLHVIIMSFLDDTPLETLYAHLHEVSIPNGAWARKGALIGYTGESGNARAPHLHFALRFCGAWIDPCRYLR